MVRFTPLLPLLLLCACPPPAGAPAAGAGEAKAGSAGPAAPAAAAPTEVAPAGEGAEKPTFVAPGSAPAATLAEAAKFRDPGWFRPTIFPGATMIKSGRSPQDDAGFFASQMTLQLAEGTSREACEETLSAAVSKDVPALAREEKDGRVTLTGDATHYSVTLICGEAKGHMTAYVAFRWTSAPS